MRKVIYGCACSLDGYLADVNGGVDWLHFSKDVQEVMRRTWATADAVLYGRKTWEIATAQPMPPGTESVRNYVFSRTLKAVGHGAEVVKEEAGEFVRRLKAERGKDIIVMGGGNFAQSLFAAKVIDMVGLNVHPILLGRGLPVFHDAGRITLTLNEARTMDGGCVLMMYEVKR